MPPSQGLSNGTLSLKFMQRAHISSNQAPVEARRAKVNNDSEWELPAVRLIPSTSTTPAIGVSYEQSYLPFLFEEVPGRRRTFNDGTEKDNNNPVDPTPSEDNKPSTSRPVITISGPPPKSISRIKRPISTPIKPPIDSPPVFMKPPIDFGFVKPPIDAPILNPATPAPSMKSRRDALSEIIAGARAKGETKPEGKREQEEHQHPGIKTEDLSQNPKRPRVDSELGEGGIKAKRKKKKNHVDNTT